MVEAFIFIVAEPNKIDKVGTEVRKIENVKEAYAVTGEFDIVIKVEAKDFSELSKVVKDKLLNIAGVVKTTTSVVIERY
ncbi:MAG: Lrp/AsnC ligand binding domain-containing protein [Thermoproteota archaeon]|jgi:DNA-binding Lrp family transcriptional regulator|nr:Lrp/AsnC ligand binding domain-containing protein [Thermoproteota archaeon]